MRRWSSGTPPFWKWCRTLILRPGAGPDPERYPLGFIPLDGGEPLESVYARVKAGYFVCSTSRIETIHNAYVGISALATSEFPITSPRDYVQHYARRATLLRQVLIPREFWALEDFNDPELNSSFGIQNLYFDNYKWSQFLWKRFQLFVEEYFPLSEHSHLTYGEYTQLIRSFYAFEEGVRLSPLLPRSLRLRTPYGVSVPNKLTMEPLLLFKHWLTNNRKPLRLQKALCVSCGSGVPAFLAKLCGVQIVRGIDPRPTAIEASRKSAAGHRSVSGVSFLLSDFLSPSSLKSHDNRKYDVIVYYPDEDMLSMVFNGVDEDRFAPGATGYGGKLEAFFENVSANLADSGVVAICCTNIYSLLYPFEHHPIEYEIKVNRRFVLLDYFDAPVKHKESRENAEQGAKISVPTEMKTKLRSELWILHKIESIGQFASIHGIPGASMMSKSSKKLYSSTSSRDALQKNMKRHVELMGGSWSDYKKRLMHMLQEQSDVPEDDVAAAVRMALDPSYPSQLAEKAREALATAEKTEDNFNSAVIQEFQDVSPREAFDKSKLVR